MEESTSYQILLDKGREAARARYASLVKLDRQTLTVKVTHFSGTSTQAFIKGSEAIQKIAPRFSILNVNFPARANKFTRAVYLEGIAVRTDIQELSENVVDKRVIWLAQQIGGLRHALLFPLKVDSIIHGAISFFSPKPFSDSQHSACESFLRRAQPSFEKLRHAEDLSQQIRTLEQSREKLIESDPLLRMGSHQFSQPLVFEGITIDPRGQSVSFRNIPVKVTPREYYVLACLISRADSAVSTDMLAMQVWGYSEGAGNTFVDSTIVKLKKNLGDAGCSDMIHQVKGYGYILQKPVH